MAANQIPIFVETVETATQDIVNADGTAVQDLVTAGVDGARVFAVSVATDETVGRDLALYLQRDGAGTNFLLGTVEVPAGSGFTGTVPAIACLDPADIAVLDTDGSLILGGGDKLRVAPTSTLTAAKTMYVVAAYGDY